jgi:hypothetical protein
MQEGQLLMTQADRDRLVTLKKAKKKLITQKQAAEELSLSTRHSAGEATAVCPEEARRTGRWSTDCAANRRIGRSKRKIEEELERQAVKILFGARDEGFGPTLAAEYLANSTASRPAKKPCASG